MNPNDDNSVKVQPTTSSGSSNHYLTRGYAIPRQNTNNFTSKLNDFGNEEKSKEHYVWEMHQRSSNITPASTVLNSPDLTESIHYSSHLNQHQIHVGRSPVSLLENSIDQSNNENRILNDLNFYQYRNNEGLTSPGSPTDFHHLTNDCTGGNNSNLISEGEIVVFDDIDTNWMKSDQKLISNEDILKVTKMIGQLPITEYEGSPRRFGNYQYESPLSNLNNTNYRNTSMSPSLHPPRPPGFPQRISPTVINEMKNNNNKSDLINIDDNDNDAKHNIDEKNMTDNKLSMENNFLDDENKPKTPTFDYLYEFSETRKVLEEFFKGTIAEDDKKFSDFNESGDDLTSADTSHEYNKKISEKNEEKAYIGHRLARIPMEELMVHRSPRKHENLTENNDIELYIDSNSRSSGDLGDTDLETNLRRHSRNFTLSPETTDYDSNCGDLDSLSNDINCQTDYGKLYTSMPVLEDGLSSGHASDTENNLVNTTGEKSYHGIVAIENTDINNILRKNNEIVTSFTTAITMTVSTITSPTAPITTSSSTNNMNQNSMTVELSSSSCSNSHTSSNINSNEIVCKNMKDNNLESIFSTNLIQSTPPPPAPAPHRYPLSITDEIESQDIQEALKDIRSALQRTKAFQEKSKFCDEVLQGGHESPVWIPRLNSTSNENITNLDLIINKKETISCHDDEEADTDLETDRLLGQQRSEEQEFFEEKSWSKNCHHKSAINIANNLTPTTSASTTVSTSTTTTTTMNLQSFSSATIRQGIGTSLTSPTLESFKILSNSDIKITSPEKLQFTKISPTNSMKSKKEAANGEKKTKTRNKEGLLDPAVLIEGVLFRARYLGSTQLVCEGQPTKSTRMMQAEEAVSRIKAPDGESQPRTEVDLFISTEKIMVLNTDLKEIMMDHALRTISYIADIGDLVVLMARRRFVPSDTEEGIKPNRTPKMICHVFESEEAQFIAQSIGQAFQVAYMEFLKANGIEDHSFVKEMDYQEVLNSQEIFGDELEIFAKKELQKEVVVPKVKGEILGVVIVESGWGSMLPTVVIANLMSTGSAARCGQLNIGDQLIAINGLSLVGLPLSTCQNYIRNTKNQTAVKFTVVPCPPVVEVKIKRPNTKYQLGFSVQNGVICSLLRGGIAERGGVRVGHRIIEINNQSVVAVPHEKIVNLLATSVGEILMKTMPTSMFRLLTGQENPIFI